MSAIPASSRGIVKFRDMGRCARCLMAGTDWHHRRSRRVKDEHQHCPCNGVWLCRACHLWAHAHPVEAIAAGFVVTQWQDEPGQQPQRRPDGWWLTGCDGSLTPLLGDHSGVQ